MEITIRKSKTVIEVLNIGNWTSTEKSFCLLENLQITNCQKRLTLLSKEFKKSFSCLVKFFLKKNTFRVKVGGFKNKTIRIQRLHPLGLHQAFSLNSLDYTAPPHPLLNWALLRLQPLTVVCSSKNVRRSSLFCFLH